MHPYFYNLSEQILSQEEKDELVGYLKQNSESFYQYENKHGEKDENNVLDIPGMAEHPIIIRAVDKFIIKPTIVVGLMHRPNAKLNRHIDELELRRTIIICPLAPTPDLYSPTYFYKLHDGAVRAIDSDLAATCTFEDGLPAIVNTKTIHDIQNNECYRFNLQFCFQQTYREIVTAYINGNLFMKESISTQE